MIGSAGNKIAISDDGVSEVEYIESDGKSYIDLGIYPSAKIDIQIGFSALKWGNDSGHDAAIFGYRLNNNNGFSMSIDNYGHIRYQLYTGGFITSDFVIPVGQYSEVQIGMNGAWINGIFQGNPVGNCPMNRKLTLFGFIEGYAFSPRTDYPFYGRIYKFKVYNNGEIILDLIPIRIKRDGAMMDRLTGDVFYNIGTGEFIIGPDKR